MNAGAEMNEIEFAFFDEGEARFVSRDAREDKGEGAMKLQGKKAKAMNPRNAYVAFAREAPGSDEFGVLVAGDYGVVEYGVTGQGLEIKRKLGASFFPLFC